MHIHTYIYIYIYIHTYIHTYIYIYIYIYIYKIYSLIMLNLYHANFVILVARPKEGKKIN